MDADRIHILVVVTDVTENTAEVLGLWGCGATACDSGAAALACAQARRPVAALLDLLIPRMDGFQFARACRGLLGCRAIPLIAVTGYWSAVSSARASHAGINHYLLEPADRGRLKALLISVGPSRGVSRWSPGREAAEFAGAVAGLSAGPDGCRAREVLVDSAHPSLVWPPGPTPSATTLFRDHVKQGCVV